jgi:uncharacterized membrane protein
MVTVPLGVPLFGLLMLVIGEGHLLRGMPSMAIVWFGLAGIVHFVIGRYGNYGASAAIGVNLTTPVVQTEVLITLVLAMFVLGEQLTPLRALGIVLVMVGPALLGSPTAAPKPASAGAGAVAPPAEDAPTARPRFVPRYAEGYAYAAVAAFGYGLSPIFIGLGLREMGGTGALAGGFVSYVAAALVVGMILIVTRAPASTYRLSRTALGWFMLAGFMVFMSHAFRYAAMALMPVSVVTALQRLSSLIRVFDSSVIMATVVSMVGAMALSVSTETFLGLADWPDWLVAIARLKWP